MKDKTIQVADLFCGAGGFSTGLMDAAQSLGVDVQLLAVNHWDVAIETHTANHKGMNHICGTLDNIDPRKAVPSGRLNLMLASPECTHHSNARGGKPMSDQSRASAWHISRWAEALYIDHIIIENVREFRDWGPLDAEGRPVASQKGALYRAFLRTLRALGYTVEDRILCAAHYGDATTRERLFIQARRGKRKPVWPEQTHVKEPQADLFEMQAWRTAREVIDWTLPGTSIYGRKKPLSENTMRRIMAGLHKFSGLPFLVGAGGPVGAAHPQSVDAPMGTLLAQNHRSLVEPYLVVFRNNCDAQSLDRPVPAICTNAGHFGLAQPYLIHMEHYSEGAAGDPRRCLDVEKPMPTITGKGQFGIIEPYLVKYYEGSDAASVDAPLPTVTANYEHLGLAQPFLMEYHGGEGGDRRTRPVDVPVPTLDTSNRLALCEPFLVGYYGNGEAHSVESPVPTITTKDRFGLIESGLIDKGDKVFLLDIKFRMLQPHELAAAMSFPPDYHFAGNREARVKQIGNAVPVRTAAALCRSAIGGAA